MALVPLRIIDHVIVTSHLLFNINYVLGKILNLSLAHFTIKGVFFALWLVYENLRKIQQRDVMITLSHIIVSTKLRKTIFRLTFQPSFEDSMFFINDMRCFTLFLVRESILVPKRGSVGVLLTRK